MRRCYELKEVIITTSWDDGHSLDLKLVKLLRKYDIPATFYIPVNGTKRGILSDSQIKEIAEHFDIGAHTLNHQDLTQVPLKKAEEETVGGKKRLEEIINKEVVSFCYPWGRYNKEVIEIVKRAGFWGARTVKQLTRSVKNPFEMGTTVHAGDHEIKHYIKQSIASRDFGFFTFFVKNNLFVGSWDQIAIKTLDFVIKNGGIWHLWGHSWEVDWGKLEDIFKKISVISKKENVIKINNSDLISRLYGEII